MYKKGDWIVYLTSANADEEKEWSYPVQLESGEGARSFWDYENRVERTMTAITLPALENLSTLMDRPILIPIDSVRLATAEDFSRHIEALKAVIKEDMATIETLEQAKSSLS